MLIISVSIVGIYSMVNNGQKLAILTDDRLTAINMAKEWIESIWALRDTFALRSYGASTCFFSIDGSNYGLCPLTSPVTDYVLSDAKTLIAKNSGDFSVCIDENGWYSQERISASIACVKTASELCSADRTRSCLTRFSRKITFGKCSNPPDLNQCIVAKVEIRWGTGWDKTLTLEQLFTRIK